MYLAIMEFINSQLFLEVRAILAQGKQRAYSAINAAMIESYWLVGKRIVEEELNGEKRAAYGEEVVKQLSVALTVEFGKGFSYSNLKNFKQFYLTFPELQKGYALRSLLSWSHYRLIMRVHDEIAREYYINECAENNWSTRTLERNITTHYYQRSLVSQNQEGALPSKIDQAQKSIAEEIVKDPYVFEFLNLPLPYRVNEREIETALINHLQEFLLELGKGFSFVGRQFRISTETSHFYIDMVFYNFILKCFVLFDIKTGKLKHQDIGQMDMYVRLFDELKRGDADLPTIGIILCTEKEETVVRYSVLSESKQLFASKYLPYLPTEEELISEIEHQKSLIERRSEIEEKK